MRSKSLVLVLAVILGPVASFARAGEILFEDVLYWMPDGSTQINPPVGPTTALVKIQETVYASSSCRTILADLTVAGLVRGPAPYNGGLPGGVPCELYSYSITNLTYAMGGGNGISGFNNLTPYGGPANVWAPNFANGSWEPQPLLAGPIEWDIDADFDGLNGDGLGIIRSQSRSEFLVAVPAGTPHGFYGGNWIHSWSGEQPGGGQINLVFGVLSGPLPEPGTLGMLLVGIGLIARRRR